MTTNTKKVFTGEVFDIDGKDTISGKYLVKFRVRTDSGIIPCIMWEQEAKRFTNEVRDGEKIYFEGYDKGGDVNIKYYKSTTGKSAPKAADFTPEDIQKHVAKMREKGFEFVESFPENALIRKRRQECVKVNGKWEGKLEYCLRVLGGKMVTQSLYEFGTPNGSNISSLLDKANPVSFKKLLIDMVAYAATETGDAIEYPEEDGQQPVPMDKRHHNQYDDKMEKL